MMRTYDIVKLKEDKNGSSDKNYLYYRQKLNLEFFYSLSFTALKSYLANVHYYSPQTYSRDFSSLHYLSLHYLFVIIPCI